MKRNNSLLDIKKAIEISMMGMMPYIQIVLDSFLKDRPYWSMAIYAIFGLYGVYLMYKQDELNDLLEFIKKHPEEFRKEVVESEEFRKGFITFFDSYLKQRLAEKRKILESILLDFTTSKQKESFELERLQDTLLRISSEGLSTLIFIKKEIIPVFNEQVNDELSKMRYRMDEKERIIDGVWARRSIAETVNKWIFDRYNGNSPLVKKRYGFPNGSYPAEVAVEIANTEHKIRKEKTESWPELVGLGILRMKVTGGLIGAGAGSDYLLTRFGLKFIEYLQIK